MNQGAREANEDIWRGRAEYGRDKMIRLLEAILAEMKRVVACCEALGGKAG